MATPIRMPALAQTSGELRLITWLKAEGEHVGEGEPLFEAETDKAELEVEAVASGTLLRCVAGAGEIVDAGAVVAWLGEPGEEIPDGGEAGQPAPEPVTAAGPVTDGSAAAPPALDARRPATPAARLLARELGVDLAQLTGSGPGGRIERRDVTRAREGRGPLGADGLVPPHRVAIAARLTRAAAVPQFAVGKTVDVRAALARAAQTDGVEGITLTHLLLRAMAAALRAVPRLNRVWLDDGPRYRQLDHCHVGLAIAAGDNLIVATIPEPDQLSLEELVRTTRRAVDEGRRGRLAGAFAAPAAVTLSNLGMFGVERFQAVVDPDQTAILAAGQVTERPSVTLDGIAAVPELDLTLTVDHRTVDGAGAAQYLVTVCEQLGR